MISLSAGSTQQDTGLGMPAPLPGACRVTAEHIGHIRVRPEARAALQQALRCQKDRQGRREEGRGPGRARGTTPPERGGASTA